MPSPSPMNILGYSGLDGTLDFKRRRLPSEELRMVRLAQGLDAAAALVQDARVMAAAAEERFSREKGTCAFPVESMRSCLAAGGLRMADVDVVAHGFSYEPIRSFFLADDDEGDLSAVFSEVYARQRQVDLLSRHFPSFDWDSKLLQVPHHLAHAASAFDISGFDEALVLVADGMGETHNTTVAVANPDEIRVLLEIPGLHSLGILYSLFTHHLGFLPGMDEYKVMGLAPYGDPGRFASEFDALVPTRPDGSWMVPIHYANQTMDEKETYRRSLAEIASRFGKPREPDGRMERLHMDIAAGLQGVLEKRLLALLRHYQTQTGQTHLCMAGGVALNCTANGLIQRSGMFRHVFVQPAAGDDGTALGAALYARRHLREKGVVARGQFPLIGPEYSEEQAVRAIDNCPDCVWRRFDDWDELNAEIVQRLIDGQIIAWFQGRMEFGPRALGNRSILADPRDPDMRDRVNRRIKLREGFRPFAPAVAAEEASRFFEIAPGTEPTHAHMLFTSMVREKFRSHLPAVVHVDGSSRVQTVAAEDNPRFRNLLDAFGRATGFPILLNTSFNVRGQPIVCTPVEALDTFRRAGLDALVMHQFLVTRL